MQALCYKRVTFTKNFIPTKPSCQVRLFTKWDNLVLKLHKLKLKNRGIKITEINMNPALLVENSTSVSLNRPEFWIAKASHHFQKIAKSKTKNKVSFGKKQKFRVFLAKDRLA